jgi:ankyrin repeat protein
VSDLHLPVRPDHDQLKHQAKELLRAIRAGAATAVAALRKHHPKPLPPESIGLNDAQLVLARSYGVPSWTRLVLACRMTSAIQRGDVETVRALVTRHPQLLHEDARGVKGHWGPPMSYAANLGKDRIIRMLHELGAQDLQFAFDRACLQGQLDTARLLGTFGARPAKDSVMGPCETQNPEGLLFLLDLGAELSDAHGDRLAPAAMLLQGYGRNATGKHQCLEVLARQGITVPDTPAMALHRGRIDLLEAHLRRDPDLLSRTFTHDEIYPPELGCDADHSLALHGTPLVGATLLHLCVDFDEIEIARWILARGGDVNAKAAIDGDGFGGHTPLFGTVVVQSPRLRRSDEFARLLLDAGADPNVRASLRKRLRFVEDETLHEYRDVTPIEWGRRFHDQNFVSKPVMKLLVNKD